MPIWWNNHHTILLVISKCDVFLKRMCRHDGRWSNCSIIVNRARSPPISTGPDNKLFEFDRDRWNSGNGEGMEEHNRETILALNLKRLVSGNSYDDFLVVSSGEYYVQFKNEASASSDLLYCEVVSNFSIPGLISEYQTSPKHFLNTSQTPHQTSPEHSQTPPKSL